MMDKQNIPSNKLGRTTIKEVAQAAGVSTMTVSRVINGRPDVSKETRQQVLDIIQALSYQPNSIARSLTQRRSHTLGVVTAGLRYTGPSRTLNGITSQAEALGYNLMLCEMPGFNTDTAQPVLDKFLASQVDGILWAVPEIGDNRGWILDRLPELPVPVIFLTMQPRENLMIVSADNVMGGRLATLHLIEQGCRCIGHISGPQDWWEARQRKLGWQQSLQEMGIDPESAALVEGNWSSSSAEQALAELLRQSPDLDGVFAGNDQMALSVLQAAHRIGKRIPQDLAVIGFDDLVEAPYFWPPLSSMHIDHREMGTQAVRELVDTIEQDDEAIPRATSKTLLIEPKLVARASSLRIS
jgi:LacI family transcriptional regulator